MNNFTKSILEGLLEKESKIVAFYGGGFKPPTKGHFEVVKQTLQDYPEIDKLYIVVGSGLRNNISQDESYSIWNIYKQYLPNKIEIIKAQSPLSYIKKYLQDNPEQTTYIIIGSREDNENDIKDFNERKSFFEKYSSNINIINLITKGGVSGTKARVAAKLSFEDFIKFLPPELTEKEQITIYDYIQSVIKEEILNENSTYSSSIDYKQQIKDLTKYFLSKHPDLKFLPKVKFIHGDSSNASDFFGKTAYYDPSTKTIVLYTEGRHPKDIVRSYSHEFIHFIQDIKGELENISTQNTTEDSHLDKIEREAYLDGNITFRNWTDSLQEDKKLKVQKYIKEYKQYFLNELFEKDLPIVNKISKNLYIVTNGDDIEAKYDFRLEIPEKSIWSLNWFFTPNNKTTTPEAWKQVTATSFKILKDWLQDNHPQSIHISGNNETKTRLYKNYINKLQTLLNNKYIIDNSDEDKIVIRSIEESKQSPIKKRMETLNESYEQSLNYWKNGDINSKSKIESWNSIKKKIEREIIEELYIKNKKIKTKKDPFGLIQFTREIIEDLSTQELNTIEKIADEWFQDYGIDVEFTNHFIERVNDPRNGKPISFEELEEMFVDAAEKYGNILSKLPEGYEAVLLKLKNDLNLPFVLKYDKKTGETDLIAKTIMRKYNFKTQNKKLTLEGRYDSITTQISSDVLKRWKEDFLKGEKQSRFEKMYENGDVYIELDANISFVDGLKKLNIDGGVDEETDYLQIRFEIDPNLLPDFWSEISFNLKDVIRHEIEHLTHGDSLSLKPSKYIEDDQFIRNMINMELLPKSQYFKLEKEIDANLQGMYLRAKKEKSPFRDIINSYLDSQPISSEEKEEILNIWRTRLPSLNLPKF
jgi:phosphopantetheine adenylyltransferase